MSQFVYVYVLRSGRDSQFYVGFTTDLKQRFADHNAGRVKSTFRRVPFELIYYEACRNQKDATKREKYLKSSRGKRYLTYFAPSGFVGPLAPGVIRCPQGPPGVSLYQDMAQAESMGNFSEQPVGVPSYAQLGDVGNANWFYNQVKTSGPWDFKNQPTMGANPQYMDFGNFHFWATGSAFGFDPLTLQNEAGRANKGLGGEGKPGPWYNPAAGTAPYGDQPTDNQWIKNGIEYKKNIQ